MRILVILTLAVSLLAADLVEAGPFGRRRVTRSTTPTCTGPNCAKPGTGGYLSINSKGGFEGALPASYFEQALQPQPIQQVTTQPVTTQAVIEQPAQVTTQVVTQQANTVTDPSIETVANVFAQALAKKLGIELPAEPPETKSSVAAVVDALPTFRVQIVSPDDQVMESADIDFATYTREQLGAQGDQE